MQIHVSTVHTYICVVVRLIEAIVKLIVKLLRIWHCITIMPVLSIPQDTHNSIVASIFAEVSADLN